MNKMDDKDKATEEAEWSKEAGDKGEFLDDGRMWPYVVPVDAFGEHIFGEYTDKLKEGVVVEYLMREYDDLMENNVKCMWLAKIVKIAGYRLLLRWVGADEEGDERFDFWVNIGSRILHSVGYGGTMQTSKLTYTYIPPKFIADRWTADGEDSVAKHIQSTMIPLQHVNDRVELLDYNNSTRVRPARVKKVVGRRICVHVRQDDFDGEVDEDDRQFGDDSEFWVDQSSFYLFHVGWACYNNYGLGSSKEYRRHAQKIADALANVWILTFFLQGEDPPYASCDVSPQKIRSWSVNKDAPLEWKKGQRFELMDPLAQMFNELRVATVLEVLKGGYLRVGMDGPDVESECIPLHCSSSFMFPVGYAQKYNIKLGGPNGRGIRGLIRKDVYKPFSFILDTEEFNWEDYLQQAGAEAAPESLFRPVPDKSYMDHFQYKQTYNCYCLLNVSIFVYSSSDIFPLGWCEMHGYKLEPPKAEEEQPAKKKKKK
ncbi:mbt repeat protein [Ancylostoma ceylanicum]|uniref:Mbt repeat protein n=1 Tax=Ancylostoma ceylanicum TaxID=53326 RepID=A0A0D6LE63_9BILA|nr:mbt repeat protein [Ancylostoma ceylanicum]